VREQVADFYAQNPVMQQLGIVCENSELCLPFTFETAKLAEAYPDLRKPMLIFEGFFDKLMQGHEHIDKLILGMMPSAK
jgi:hypothetical protein